MTVGRALYFEPGGLLLKLLNRRSKALAVTITVTGAGEITLCCASYTTEAFSPIMLLTRWGVSTSF